MQLFLIWCTYFRVPFKGIQQRLRYSRQQLNENDFKIIQLSLVKSPLQYHISVQIGFMYSVNRYNIIPTTEL